MRVGNALQRPTVKQTEALARYLHTLSAAALIGGATLPYTEPHVTVWVVVRVTFVVVLAVVLFFAGTLELEDT